MVLINPIYVTKLKESIVSNIGYNKLVGLQSEREYQGGMD